jgi:hypothetical protein
VREHLVYFVIGQPRKQRATPKDLPSFWCRPNQSATSRNDRADDQRLQSSRFALVSLLSTARIVVETPDTAAHADPAISHPGHFG